MIIGSSSFLVDDTVVDLHNPCGAALGEFLIVSRHHNRAAFREQSFEEALQLRSA